MDIWVNKIPDNYDLLANAYQEFGAPIFSKEDFLSNKFDVWGIGVETNKIEIMSQVKGLNFDECLAVCKLFDIGLFEVPFVNLHHLLKAKAVAGRFKDKADIEELMKKNKLD